LKANAFLILFCLLRQLCFSQVDTVNITEQAVLLFPSFPVKSSYTSLFDRRAGFDYVYSANMESGLGIYDVSTPSVINNVLNLPISFFNNLDVSTIEQRNNSLIVGIGDFQVNNNASSGIMILDISNPLSPTVKDSWDSTIFTHGISHLCIDGNYAYLSTMTNGIIIVDISDEQNIIYKSHLQLDLNFPLPSPNAHNARGLKIINDTLYVCFDRGGLRVVDVTDKSNPVEVYQYINTSLNSQAAAAYNDLTIKGNYAFISVDYCGLEVIDISSIPFTPVQWYNPWNCNTTNWSGAALHTNEIMISNNDSLLFVTGAQSELFIFDITNPLLTHKVGEFVNLNDTLATHGLDVYQNKVVLSLIHTPVHIPPFTPFYADPGGLKIVSYQILNLVNLKEKFRSLEPTIKIYPNPIEGNFFNIESFRKINNVKIYNLTGQQVFTLNHISNNATLINTLNWAPGLYQVMVSDDYETQHFKIIKP
jgi:hypothetical protein